MPKIIIDTDEMLVFCEELKKPEEKQQYIMHHLRQAIKGDIIVPWMWLIEPSLERLSKWAEASKKGASIGGYSPAFMKFWETYPSRNGVRSGKSAAMKAWKKVKGISEPELLKACLAALEWQLKDEQWTKDKGTFVPMATTYINQRRWEDEGTPNPDEWEEYTDMNGATKQRRKS